MKNLVTVLAMVLVASVSQAAIFTNACNDVEDGQWVDCGTFALSNVPSVMSLDGAMKAVSTTGGASFVWKIDGTWNAGLAVTTSDTLSLALKGGCPDFRIGAIMDDGYAMLRDYSWNNGEWTNVSYNFPRAGNVQYIQFDYYGSGQTAYLDNVVVTPEPTTMALLGLAGVLGLRRKK